MKIFSMKEYHLDMLQVCIHRICVTDDLLEIMLHVGDADRHINALAQNRISELAGGMDEKKPYRISLEVKK